MQHAVSHAETFAAITRIFDHAQRRMPRRIPADDVAVLSAGTVVHNNDFYSPGVLPSIFNYFAKEAPFAPTRCRRAGRC